MIFFEKLVSLVSETLQLFKYTFLFRNKFSKLFSFEKSTLEYPNSGLSLDLFKSILEKSWWPFYDRPSVLNELNSTTEASIPSLYFSYIALSIYTVIANVLLLNFLIAMFSWTFHAEHANNDQKWKFLRFKLVFEYIDSSIFPAPLNFFSFLIGWVNSKRSRREKTVDQEAANKATAPVEIDYIFEERCVEAFIKSEEKIKSEHFETRINECNSSLKKLEIKLNEAIDSRLRDARQLEKLEELLYQVSVF